jgi:hypothetical protein
MKPSLQPVLRPTEADVIYQLLHSPDELWEPTPAQTRTIVQLCRRGTLQARRHGRQAVPKETFAAFRNMVLKAREQAASTATMLNNSNGAILASIRQCPEYRFVGCELRQAKRLEAAGVLRPASKRGRFLVTFKGYCRYDWDSVSAP